jgi:hypothetical protein
MKISLRFAVPTGACMLALLACGSDPPASSTFDAPPPDPGSSSGGYGQWENDAGGSAAPEGGKPSGRKDGGREDSGQVGQLDGSGGNDAGPDVEQCSSPTATVSAVVTKSPLFMMFVADGSGSMDGDKLTAQTAALDSIFDQILAEQDTGIGVGLISFSDSFDSTLGVGPYPVTNAAAGMRNDVPIGFVDQAHHDALRARIDGATASGSTPTLAALTGGYGVLKSFVPSAPLPSTGKSLLVLLTDGVPTDSQPADNIALATLNLPIQTFAIGVGAFPPVAGDYDPVFLGQLAVAGGTAKPGCNPTETADVTKVCHFQITPNGQTAAVLAQQFETAINTLRGQAASCDLGIVFSSQADPGQATVTITDPLNQVTTISKDATNGWTYDNDASPTRLLLHGNACQLAVNNGTVGVKVACK